MIATGDRTVTRCSLCILPTHLPGMDVDEQGRCRYCREAKRSNGSHAAARSGQAHDGFRAIAERLKGKGKYDCLVPFSGGKESSYILWMLVSQYGLRPLAFNMSNGFQHPDAIRNIEAIVDRLGVDLVICRPSQAMIRKLMRAFLIKAGEFCTPCNMLISATGFRLARQHGIRVIMSGNAAKTNPGLDGVSSATYYDRVYYLNVAGEILSRADRGYYLNPGYVRTAVRRMIGADAHVMNVLDYVQPSLEEMHRTLESIGWKRPAGAIQHGDCVLDAVKEYLYYRRWQCTEVTALYSVLIRNGEITREEALQRALGEEHSRPPEVLPQFISSLGISESDLDEAVQRDFRTIQNIRNSQMFRYAKKAVHAVERIRTRS
ncbi:MAG: hypothetical protein JW955_20080 [Sedimentisphaerales bacterium]|nr:hypothetical protein [Sedimentisphaerales bacterium]